MYLYDLRISIPQYMRLCLGDLTNGSVEYEFVLTL